MWDWLNRVGLVVFLSFAGYCVFYNSTPHYGEQPSGDVLLKAEQYDRMQDLMTDMEKVIEKNGLPMPGSRRKYVQ